MTILAKLEAATHAQTASELLASGKIKIREGFRQATRTEPAQAIKTYDAYTSVGPVCCKTLMEAVELLSA